MTVPRWAFAGLGYALLLAAWAFASPIGAVPDERAHAIRAAAAGRGQWEGRPAAPFQRESGLRPALADYLDQQSQTFTVPAAMVPPEPCFASQPDVAATCVSASGAATAGSGGAARSAPVTVTSYATTAPPFLYALAGLAMRAPQDLVAPPYLGRLALALVCALLLGAAAWAAGVGGWLWPAVGVALAATPMVLFLGAGLTPAGVALCAAICFTASVLATWAGVPRAGLLPVLAVSGAVLGLSRPSGLLSLAVAFLMALPMIRLRALRRPSVLLAYLVVAAAAVVGAGWATGHQPAQPLGGSSIPDALPVLVRLGPDLLSQLVGVFGMGEVRPPAAVPVAWDALVALLLGAALLIGRWRDRLALLLAAGAAVLVAASLYAFVLVPVGWTLEGRHLLAVAVLLPVLAGFAIQESGLQPRFDAFLVGLAVAALQFVAFWENARRYAVGRHGPLDFVDAAQWSPPEGWMPWVLLAGAGCLLVALSLLPLTGAEREGAWGPVVVDPEMVSVSR